MFKRKRYLYSHVDVPARTLRYRRRKEALALAAYASELASSKSSASDLDSTRGQISDQECAESTSMFVDSDGDELQRSPEAQPRLDGPNIHDNTTGIDRMDSGLPDSPNRSIILQDQSSSSAGEDSEGEASDSNSTSSFAEDDGGGQGDALGLEQTHMEAAACSPPIQHCQEEIAWSDDCFSSAIEHDDYLKSPLTDFVDTTKGEAMVMCLAFGLRHNLSWAGIVDMLKVINELFKKQVIKETKYFLQKYMDAGKGNVQYHLYCPYCSRYLGSRNEVEAANVGCPCGKTIKDVESASTFFVSVSLSSQIKDLLQDPLFVENLHHRFNRKKINEDAYEDIYDGEVYKKHSAQGEILSYWHNMSYMINTDGFPVGGKGGKQTCWPIYIQINELPLPLRSKYMLLAGIYVGKKDPNMNIFLYPFVEEANALAREGINWQFKTKVINSKVIPLYVCVDTPARSKMLNTTFFGGSYGCSLCYANPESTAVGKRYTIQTCCANERTHEEMLIDSVKAHNNFTLVRNKKKRRVRGLRGPSPIHYLSYLDLVKGIRPDTMHSMLLGNAKHITTILLEGVGREYYIGSEVRLLTINKRLNSIRPPASVFRTFKNFSNFTSLKARDWRSWLLFYAIPCLLDVIPQENLNHLSLLSTVLHIVLNRSITEELLDRAEALALRYVFLLEQFYSKTQMLFNVHLLMHLRKNIEYLGPSFTNVAFGFESANKDMLQLKKGASSIAKEITNKYLTFKSLPQLCDKYCSSDSTLELCQNFSGRQFLKSIHRVKGAVLAGKGKREILGAEEKACLTQMIFDQSTEHCLTFERLFMGRVCYHVASYNRASNTDDSYISVQSESKARIHKILLMQDETCPSVILLVREIILDNTPIFNDEYGIHCPIKKVSGEGQLLAIRPEDISGQCVAMFVESGNFICDVPYGCYGDT